MRARRTGPLAALTALVVVALSAPAALAGPGDGLCDSDPVRGPVPPDLLVDACVDGASVVLRNDLDRPVVVTAEGTGDPARTRTVSGPRSEVVRRLADAGTTLLPGDAARWPLEDGPARLTIVEAEPRIASAVVADLGPLLPREGTAAERAATYQVAAGLVRDLVPVVEERAACVEGRNWLGTAGCDVSTAAQLGRAVGEALPEEQADAALAVVLDRASWARWAESAGAPAEGSTVLVQQPTPGWGRPVLSEADGSPPQTAVRVVAVPAGAGDPDAGGRQQPAPSGGGGSSGGGGDPAPARPRPVETPPPAATPPPAVRPQPVVVPRPVQRPPASTPPVAGTGRPGADAEGPGRGDEVRPKEKAGKEKAGKEKSGPEDRPGKKDKGGSKGGKGGGRGR